MAERKERFALITRYKKLCATYGYPVPHINMNVEQWSSDALVESYGLSECYNLLDYYFEINKNPNWSRFTYVAGDLLESKAARDEDIAHRARMREKGKAWLND